MPIALIILRLLAGFGIYNVWFLRPRRATEFRGGDARTLKEEFRAYGLPDWSRYLVGTLKISAATGMILSIWLPFLMPYSALALSVLMVGAIFMHIRVKDSLKQVFPALLMLIITLLTLIFPQA